MEEILRQTVKDYSKQKEILQTIIIALLAFLVPTFLGQVIKTFFGEQSIITNNSQIIIGSIVNTALVISALNIKGISKLIFVVTMPSISTILSGYVFKSASIFMVWLIPAIWLGNFALIFAFKYIMLQKRKNYFLASVIGIITKVVIIFGFFMILKLLNIFPQKIVSSLQNAMSVIQLITATIGCIVSFIVYKYEKKEEKK